MSRSSRALALEVLEHAGIEVNGPRPWDIHISDDRFYDRVLRDGNLGLGESYMDGWWTVGDLAEFICRLMKVDAEAIVRRRPRMIAYLAAARLVNFGSAHRAFDVAERHYNLGSDLFEAMLDSRMAYSCGYWEHARTLEEAQEHKLDMVCRKVGLQPGMTVLEIGCGWGSFMKFAAERYGVRCVGISVSEEQTRLGRERCAGLPIEFRLQDYREVEGRYDRVVSIAMFEQVGPKNMRTFFETVRRALLDDGLFLLHTLGLNVSTRRGDPFNDKYIFPNGHVPSIKQLGAATEKLFVMEDWHNFGADYDRTVHAWYDNVRAAWPRLSKTYDERFYRMWTYYLLSCAGVIRSRYMQVWQIVYSKTGVAGGYRRVPSTIAAPASAERALS
jgi:cyclopropane-fatty-acyl-phospholipid synthase